MFETVECYSFAESCWRTKPDLCSPRDGLGIAVYDGNIFVAGGEIATLSDKISADKSAENLACCQRFFSAENFCPPKNFVG